MDDLKPGVDRVKACPVCSGPVFYGFVGTNGRVFWSEKEHFLGVVGDEVLIPISWVTTSYLPATRCRRCGLVMFQT